MKRYTTDRRTCSGRKHHAHQYYLNYYRLHHKITCVFVYKKPKYRLWPLPPKRTKAKGFVWYVSRSFLLKHPEIIFIPQNYETIHH